MTSKTKDTGGETPPPRLASGVEWLRRGEELKTNRLEMPPSREWVLGGRGSSMLTYDASLSAKYRQCPSSKVKYYFLARCTQPNRRRLTKCVSRPSRKPKKATGESAKSTEHASRANEKHARVQNRAFNFQGYLGVYSKFLQQFAS